MRDLVLDDVAIDAPIRILVDLWLSDCESRNLSPYTLRGYRLKICFLVDEYGDRRPADLSAARLKLFVSQLRDLRGWSVTQTNHVITAIKIFFTWLEREGFIQASPARMVRKLKTPQRLPKSLPPEEVQALIDACTPSTFCGLRDRTMILVCLDTGARIGELSGMSVGDVDLVMGQVRVFGKGRKERMVPFEATTRKALVRWLAVRSARAQCDDLWISPSGYAVTTSHIRHRLESAAKRAGVQGFTPHRLRHTAATWFLQAGGSAAMLQRMLGHTSSAMTQRYTHLVDSDVKVAHKSASPVERLKLRRNTR